MLERCSMATCQLARSGLVGVGLLLAVPPATLAQQITGVSGSPDATTTIDGRYLPPPPQRLEGQINLDAALFKPAWPARVVRPLTITRDPPKLTPDDVKRLEEAARRGRRAMDQTNSPLVEGQAQ